MTPNSIDIEVGTARVVVTPRRMLNGELAVSSAPDLETAMLAVCRALGTADALDLARRLEAAR